MKNMFMEVKKKNKNYCAFPLEVIFHISRKTRMIEKKLKFCFATLLCYPKRAHRR